MTEFLRGSDAFTWAMESDPRLRSTVVTLVIMDRAPAWTELRERFAHISRRLPMMRQRVVQSPPLTPPRWEDAPDVDLGFHLRRVRATAPGDLAVVLEMARIAEMEDFDRARPLWCVTLIDGLADGGAALLCKFHHALTDGVGGVQIAMMLFDLTEHPDRGAPMPAAPRETPRSWPAGYRELLGVDLGAAAAAVAGAISTAPQLLAHSVRHPLGTVETVAGTGASIFRTVRPVRRTGSPLMTQRSLIRRLGVHRVPMPRLRLAAHRGGGALNDGFVAGLAGGLRRYHDLHDVTIGDLHLTMPINLRTEQDAVGGNRIGLMRFDVPAGIVDPAERIRAVHDVTSKVRGERSLPFTQWIAGVLNLMPRWYIGSVLRHVDFLASDVPGVPVPVFLGGARVVDQYAFGPTIGAAVNVTLLTYVDTCALGIDVDTGAIGDFEAFHDCLVAGFDEVLALAD